MPAFVINKMSEKSILIMFVKSQLAILFILSLCDPWRGHRDWTRLARAGLDLDGVPFDQGLEEVRVESSTSVRRHVHNILGAEGASVGAGE